jgi:hypothetical protein
MKRGREEKGELNCLMLLSKVGESEETKSFKKCGFKCKTCNKEFSSFQALGGHRASHKRPKLIHKLLPTMKSKMHSCPICGLEFSIGQALGGHMRKHNTFSIMKNSKDCCVKLNSCFDLNLTPLENGIAWT